MFKVVLTIDRFTLVLQVHSGTDGRQVHSGTDGRQVHSGTDSSLAQLLTHFVQFRRPVSELNDDAHAGTFILRLSPFACSLIFLVFQVGVFKESSVQKLCEQF
jgi:hypothetical protein